ncbi:Histidine kinase [Phytophthora cinnamomi]|uniref:Histidine kinase n=1 Tax=Phytophthora cinnamomi TaxID=4785 RepID=UPI00355A1C1E|nr:Histidine kinase [Phytophthora cinnamomi]
MASKSGDVTDEDDLDVDVERLQAVTLGMKRQADELLLANQLDKALTLYRELLMHLTRSQVALLRQKELVVSCHMNALAALSKAKRWGGVVSEAAETFAVLAELKEAEGAAQPRRDEQQRQDQVLARAFYFRGFAYMKLGTFLPAQQDFRRAMELNPEDEAIQSDYKELQAALLAEQKVKQCLATSMKFFQAGNYKSAVEACVSALRESQLLQKTELTGLIHGNLAAIYVKMKDDAKAIEHYKRTMLLTRCGGKPTAAQNERMFDILDSLAGCYSRKRDYSSALSVIEDQVKLFPLCPERKDREAMMFLNAGRICYTMGRCPQAEEHLEKGYNAARKEPNQLDVALNCAFWLSKAYLKNSKAEKAMEILDATIPLAEEDTDTTPSEELLEKLMLARLDLLDPELNNSAAESSTFKGSLREAQLWQTLELFESKRLICGHIRLGMVEEASKVVEEIESFPTAQNSNELTVIKDRLAAAAAADARNKKQKKIDRADRSSLFEKQHCSDGESSFLCGIGRVWWGRWCGPLIACVTAVAMVLMFA